MNDGDKAEYHMKPLSLSMPHTLGTWILNDVFLDAERLPALTREQTFDGAILWQRATSRSAADH